MTHRLITSYHYVTAAIIASHVSHSQINFFIFNEWRSSRTQSISVCQQNFADQTCHTVSTYSCTCIYSVRTVTVHNNHTDTPTHSQVHLVCYTQNNLPRVVT